MAWLARLSEMDKTNAQAHVELQLEHLQLQKLTLPVVIFHQVTLITKWTASSTYSSHMSMRFKMPKINKRR